MTYKRGFRLSGISLKTQLILSFVAVTLIVLSVSSYYSYKKTFEIQKNRTRDTTLAQFRQIETNILTLLHEVDKLSNTFLLETDVQTFLESGLLPNADFIPLQQDITKLMSRYIDNYDYLDSIYLFSGNGMVIGGTRTQNQSSTVVGKDYPFYSHPLYRSALADYPRKIWSGGVTSKDFMRTPPAYASLDNPIISSLMGAKSIGSARMSAVLVVNVKESYLNSLYGRLGSGLNGSLHIIDGDGTVISSTLEKDIGRPYLFDERIDEGGREGPFGSFTATRGNSREQVLYYHTSEPGWILTDEVPSAIYSKETVEIQRFTAGIFVLSVVLIVALASLWMGRIMGSLQELIKGMRYVGRGNIGLTLPRASSREIGQLTEQFNRMSKGIMELLKQNEEAEKEKRRLEIEALQSQINPHFLFNTLNTVKWMAAVAGANNIMECITNLGNMLRPIYNNPTVMWSIEEEIEFIKNYANIMNFRYGEEVEFVYDVPELLLKCQTLRFMIQPLIENALIHGKSNKGVIRVSVSESNGDVVMAVLDTRGGMTPGRAEELNRTIRAQGNGSESKGIGLSNVDKRIRLHFGDRYCLLVENDGGSETRVSMKIPLIQSGQSVQNS